MVRRQRSNFDAVPKFYTPGHARAGVMSSDDLRSRQEEIDVFFSSYPEGIPVEKFVYVTKRICGLPSFFNLPLCRRMQAYFGDNERAAQSQTAGRRGSENDIKISLASFLRYWSHEVEPYDPVERFFRAVKQPSAEYIVKDDFGPYIQELLHFHPGLDFLGGQEEFQKKYALTVVTRIFYKVNSSRSGKISLRELRHSNLIEEFMHVDEEVDINKVYDYFSYEHFYVLY